MQIIYAIVLCYIYKSFAIISAPGAIIYINLVKITIRDLAYDRYDILINSACIYIQYFTFLLANNIYAYINDMHLS